MKRVYAVIELADTSDFDLGSETDQDDLADDLLRILPGVLSATVYTCATDLNADEAA